MFMARSHTPHLDTFSSIHGGRIFKARGLSCKATFISTANLSDESNFEYTMQRPDFTLVEYIFEFYYLKAKLNDLIILIAHNSTVTKFIDEATRILKKQVEFHAQVFVLFPEVGDLLEEETYSGFYACWFSDGCMVRFNCSGPSCSDSMWQVFNSATNFGKKIRPVTVKFKNMPLVRPQSFLGSPFQRNKSWTLQETIHFFLTGLCGLQFYSVRKLLQVCENTL
ncbi:unnamed protein product, partial [Allacma fusca]